MALKNNWVDGTGPNSDVYAAHQNAIANAVNQHDTDVANLAATKQPLDTDLTAIASLAPPNDDVLQRKSGAWTNRTPAQLKTDMALGNVTNNAQYFPGGADVGLGDGGTGASLTDPNADRIMFWDDSTGAVTWLTLGTNLTITGTTINAAGGGGGATNLAATLSASNVIVTSDTGTDATIPAVTGTNSGVMTPAQKAKLDAAGDFTAAGRALVDDANATEMRTTLGLTDVATGTKIIGSADVATNINDGSIPTTAFVQAMIDAALAIGTPLSALQDVEIVSPPAVGDVLTFNGLVWVPQAPTGEPPPPPSSTGTYDNFQSGVGTRNGTTSHTIGHSTAATAPSAGCGLSFVPTAGNTLAVIACGAMSHSSTGSGAGSGWTEQLSEIGSCELALYTKTAAGNDFLTLSHGAASNYPLNWVVLEFPAGTTYTGGASETQNDDTFPAITLPGTDQFVIAAYSIGIGAASPSPVGGSTVAAPWVEDYDSAIAGNGVTDGNYLYVFHQLNVTATSLTPTMTPGVSGIGTITDRGKIVAAFEVG